MQIQIDTSNQQDTGYPFTPAEFERLYAYRQAVLASYFTDQISDERCPHCNRRIPEGQVH